MFEMTIALQPNSDASLYEQIYAHIRQEIREGKLLAGEKLPSARSMAEFLQVSRCTVDTAYDQLVSEGYLEAKAKRGYFVAGVENLFGDGRFKEMESGVAAAGESKASGAVVAAGKAFAAGGKEALQERGLKGEASGVGQTGSEAENVRYDFSPTGIDMGAFPYSVWKKITKEILVEGNHELFAAGDRQGDLPLRETIAKYLHAARGLSCDPAQIILGAGHDYLLMLLEKILGKDVTVGMEKASYMRAYRILASFGYEMKDIAMDESGMLTDALDESGATLAYVMPSHQYPTGIVMPIARRLELLSWAYAADNRYIIEDDYDSEFRYRGKPIPALQPLDQGGRVIYMGTFSRAIAPAIRVGYMVLPMDLLLRYREVCGFYSCSVPRIDQQILNTFMKDGYFERHLNKMRKQYKAKHDLLLEALKPLEETFAIKGEDAGLHILLESKEKKAAQALCARALLQGVKVYPMTEEENCCTLMLGFGGLTEAEIKEGSGILAACLRQA